MLNAEYDFADENENTNEKTVDEQSTGDHEDSDGEGIQGPPRPAEFKRLLEVWAKDFEKLEAANYQQTTAAEDISGVEAQRLRDAVDAATTTVQTSSGLIHKFMNHSGDPEMSEIFREIHMEATFLLGARNNATRKSAKAKEAAELVVSKQGLAKDPAAVTAANQLFATSEDKRTRIQTRVAKFIPNPLLDHQKTANSSTAEKIISNIHASGILNGTPGNPGLTGTKTKLEDNVFDSGRISEASAYLKDYPGLQWPHGAPAAIALT